MEHIPRLLELILPEGRSAFLWGPRQSGKTTLLRSRLPHSLRVDLLDTDLFLEYSRRPARFREHVLAQQANVLRRPIIVDEIQKVPQLLDEIHGLIENQGLRFLLSGSSARKLRRGHTNLLGGRAWRYQLFPLVFAELKSLELLRILNRGLVPSHYVDPQYRRSLKALAAHSSYRGLDYAIQFWRTKSGLEVDFVLGQGEVAIEVKGASRLDDRELRALSAFQERYRPGAALVVCNETRERRKNGIRILPLARFLEDLWAGKIIS